MLVHLTRFFRLAPALIAFGLAACGGSPTPYPVGGTLSSLLPGNSITLTNNGKDTLTLSTNGAFAFTTKLPEAANYSVTAGTPTPVAQTCKVTNATGSVNAASATVVNVSCEVPTVAAGQVEATSGEVQDTTLAGQQRTLHPGDTINEGDALRSGPKATARIKMGDGGMITMRPDTEFKIDSYSFNGKQDGTEKSFFSLFRGGFRSVTGLIGRLHKESYHIKTANAVLGIRGTDHEVYLVVAGSEAAKLSRPGTYDRVYSGSTALTNDKGTVVIAPQQMGYVAAPDQKPKLQPIDTKLFAPAIAPVAAQPPKVEYAFDGRWATKLVCDDTTDRKNQLIKGYTWAFDVTIDHGKLNGQYGQVGQPASGTFTGEVHSDGQVSLDAKGLTGNPNFALGKISRGSPYSYQMEGEFSGSAGHATRTAARPCHATFTKL